MLNGKTALITGGARGIGAAICRKLASLGADIAMIALTADEQANNQIAAISADVRVYNVDSADTLTETIKAVNELC